MMMLLIFLLVAAAAGLFVFAFAKPKAREDVASRLKRAKKSKRASAQTKKQTLFERAEVRLQPLAEKRMNTGQGKSLQARLEAAGRYDSPPARHMARQFLFAGIIPLTFLLADAVVLELPKPLSLFGTIGMAFLGYFLPSLQLNAEIERRRTAILRALPTMLDLLTTCVEAGMSLQAALSKVSEMARESALKTELERTLKEIQLGRPRGEALRALGKRVGLKELNSVAIALVQAETMGISINGTLRIQSGIMREARWQRAQELAQKAPLKLIFPITFLIFPVIFVVIFGPLVIALVKGVL